MKATNHNYCSAGKTVGIYVYIDGEKKLFTLDSELREQIARRIEEEICPEIHTSAELARVCAEQGYAYRFAAKIARDSTLL